MGPIAEVGALRDDEVDGPRPVILFALDWTLLNGVTLQHLARRCGVYAEAKRIWTAHGSADRVDGDALEAVAALFEGQRLSSLEAACRQMFLRPESGEVITALAERGFATGVIADSFQLSADIAAHRLGMQVAAGARLEVEDGILTGELTPSPTGDCRRWVCREVALGRMATVYEAPFTVAVGDGAADLCMLEAADLGIAEARASDDIKGAADRKARLSEVPEVIDAYLDEEDLEIEADPLARDPSRSRSR